MSAMICTQEELEELCKQWTKILHLENWDIKLFICHEKDFTGHDNQGEIDYIMENGDASIKILHPDSYPNSPFEYDMEKTLVHELLHLHFAPFRPEDESSLNFVLWERAIETMARIMVDLDRQSEPVIEFTLDEEVEEEIIEARNKKKGRKK